jgi:aryl-alcohol dehydrogenase-like predicted oxidoreductase
MREPGKKAIGTWSGGRFLHFGEAIEPERLEALLRPGDGIDTVLTADAYGAGEADSLLGRGVDGVDRDSYSLIGAVGHDFYEGERQGPKGYPRFTDRSLRPESEYAGYLRMASERSLERLGQDRFDLLLLHNPDRTGYESESVWKGMTALRDAGLAGAIGIAPGPANGFTLDLIRCFERFGGEIEWAMIILNPMAFRPEGWIAEGRAKLDRMRTIAEWYGMTPLQLACAWNLSHEAVECVVPTLIQEMGEGARPIEDKRAELASLPEKQLSKGDMIKVRKLGDNAGCMALKGATPDHAGEERPDRWPISDELAAVASGWGIDPERDLRHLAAEPAR